MAIETDENGNVLSLPFQAEELSYVRVRQADLARMFKISPARVSQLVKEGKITRFADGTIDPARAARELAKNCDINRLRGKPFRPLAEELEQLRDQARALKTERDGLAEELERVRSVEGEHIQILEARLRAAAVLFLQYNAWLDFFMGALMEIDLQQLNGLTPETWEQLLQECFDSAYREPEDIDLTAEAKRSGEIWLAPLFSEDENAVAVIQDDEEELRAMASDLEAFFEDEELSGLDLEDLGIDLDE